MNDDMFLGAPISKSHFYDNHGNLRLHMSTAMAPQPQKMKENLWHAAVGNSNALINQFYYPGYDPQSIQHHYVQHACYFMRKDVSIRKHYILSVFSSFVYLSVNRFWN